MLRSTSSLNSVLLKQIQADSSKPRTEIAGFKLIDFKQSVFDGEYRDTIRWIRYFEDTFKEKSIFYLFDPLHPALVRPNSYYALREVEAAREMEQIQRFSIQQAAWEDIVDVVDWYHDREFIANMPAGAQKSAAELLNVEDRAALIVAHPPPVREAFASMFTNIHVHAIKEYERLRDKEEVDAGSALGILKSKVGTKITTYLTSSWDNNAYSTINKARSTWDYISQFLRANIDAVMVAIDDDFTSIPMARTVPGARVNYIKMQRLREDCVRVGRDKTDVELVSKMRGKMTGPAFVRSIKFYSSEFRTWSTSRPSFAHARTSSSTSSSTSTRRNLGRVRSLFGYTRRGVFFGSHDHDCSRRSGILICGGAGSVGGL
jgi:hypothetical protein